MLPATKTESPNSPFERAADSAAGFFGLVKNLRATKHESLSGHPVDRQDRGSYYVFRRGTLQMQVFDRQTFG